MIKKGLIFCIISLLTACSLKSNPISVETRYSEAQQDIKELFDPQKNLPKKIDYYEALARSLKYNLDYRIKLVNYALQAGQLNVAEFTMFPAFNTSGSLYSRNNAMSSFGTTTTGQITDVLNSTPQTLRSARGALSWNILDFGLGYVRARQQSERILIAEEEGRKQVQTLTQDVLVAYWSAYNAQQLMTSTREFQHLLNQSKERLVLAVADKTIPQENILNYQAALLEGNRRLVQLKYKYDKAILDLRHLLDLPPDQKIILLRPPAALTHAQNLKNLDFKKLDAISLTTRPELRGQEYQKRIAEFGVKTAILQALPGITLNEGWNYNSNKYLINRLWIDRSMDVAWNLLNLASLPTTYTTAKIQVKYEKLKRMALTITVLTETRYAYWHYQTLSEEYAIAHKQTENAEALYTLNHNRELASLASNQQVILAKLHALTSRMDEDLLLSDLSTALGELYLSTGSDILPVDVENKSIPELTKLIKDNFALQKVLDFNKYIDNTYATLFNKTNNTQHLTVATKSEKFLKKTNVHKIAITNIKKQKIPTQKIMASTKLTAPTQKASTTPDLTSSPYTVQIFGSYHLSDILNLQSKLPIKQNSYYGQTKHNGNDWYILTIGHYKTAHEAKADMKQLPKKFQEASAWVRKTNNVKWLA
ncbi:MAG: TolC family protein [Gammaproteobacteria bacterium]|nr:TolC family protein [Gammaproteobacteria bacterium]